VGILKRLILLALLAGAALGGVGPLPVAAQLAGGTNLTLTPSTTSPEAGETVTFSYRASPPAVAPPFASITSLMLDFGDGTTADLSSDYAAGQTVTGSTAHAYDSPGTYTAILTASASNGGGGRATAQITVSGGGAILGQGIKVTYQPGWNLIAVPLNTTIPGPLGPLYTYQAGDTTYEMVQNTQPGLGYWAFFSTPTTATLSAGSPQRVSLPLPAGQWVMVGNPGSFPATVHGADMVYAYNPSTGYQQTTALQPGQGAWVFSASGGTVTIAN
jgi:hypothetical protein